MSLISVLTDSTIMTRVTEEDFEKVRKWLSILQTPLEGYPGPIIPGPNTINPKYAARQQAYELAKPGATFLIQCYFTLIDPDDGERNGPGWGDRPYGLTKTEHAINRLNNNWPDLGKFGEALFDRDRFKPEWFEIAITAYKKNLKENLERAMVTTLEKMTGGQLLLVLQEHERRRGEGFPLTIPIEGENGMSMGTYKNPYDGLATIDAAVEEGRKNQDTPSE